MKKKGGNGKVTGLQMLQVVLLLIRSEYRQLQTQTHSAECSCAVPGLVWPGLCIVSEAQIVTSSTDTRRHKTLSLWQDTSDRTSVSHPCQQCYVQYFVTTDKCSEKNQSETAVTHILSLSLDESHVLRCIVSTFFVAVYSFHAFAERYMIIILDS